MGTSKKSSFVYYLDWAEELLTLPSELRLKVDDAVKRYVLYGEEPTDREVIYSMFGLMRKQIDRDTDKWNDIRFKRSEAGRKGAEVTNRQKSANDGKSRQKDQQHCGHSKCMAPQKRRPLLDRLAHRYRRSDYPRTRMDNA